MRDPRNEGRGQPLDLSQNFLGDGPRAAAYARLLEDVFGATPDRSDVPDPPWDLLAFFEPDGDCVAGVEVGELSLVLDGVHSVAIAIRLAGVVPSHRGRGLFRDLMDTALAFSDRRGDGAPVLLYTGDASLYARFGFVPLAQHAFAGVPPAPAPSPPARYLDRTEAVGLIDRVGPKRAPVSRHCAVHGALDLLRSNLDDDDLRFAVLGPSDALVVYEQNEDELVIVDVVGATIPTMAEIVGAVGPRAGRVRTLFPPDRLGWDGVPLRDETGLMIRGRVPEAMQRPFMLPPTTSF